MPTQFTLQAEPTTPLSGSLRGIIHRIWYKANAVGLVVSIQWPAWLGVVYRNEKHMAVPITLYVIRVTIICQGEHIRKAIHPPPRKAGRS